MDRPRPWPKKESRRLGDFRIFQLREDCKTNPRSHRDCHFIILECPDWVQVIPVTADGHFVMVEQFRHGSNTVELEWPGGIMDPHETDPSTTARRELVEETGYDSEEIQSLGSVFANPAMMDNRMHYFLARNCRLLTGTRFDPGEDLMTRLVPVDEINDLVRAGHIRHSLAVAALQMYHVHAGDPPPGD